MLEDSKIMHVVKKWAGNVSGVENISLNGITNNTETLDDSSNQLVDIIIKLLIN